MSREKITFDLPMLTPIVRQALADQQAEIATWQSELIYGDFLGDDVSPIYRIHGTAQSHAEEKAWSLILKIVHPGVGGNEETNWFYWQREPLLYQSGLLDDLPGPLCGPTCYGVTDGPDEEVWIWLEEVIDEAGSNWSLETYSRAARHLGEFNGLYLAGRPFPDAEWLSTGRVHPLLTLIKPVYDQFDTYCAYPINQCWFSAEDAERTQDLWSRGETLVNALDSLPQTFVHHDAFRRNLFTQKGPNGEAQTVAIDWSFAGRGPIGAEAGVLMAVSLEFLDFDAAHARELDQAIFTNYVDGLRASGWQGDPAQARLGYTATATLLSAIHRAADALGSLYEDEWRDNWEAWIGHPLDDILAQWALLQPFLLDLGDEAIGLLSLPRV